ncbi:MAG: YlxR family protein [Desulfomonile sp.]|nr:YlxR family protein [Desulfomonile sp.]
MKRGHIPIRQCIGCRTRRPKDELLRIVALDDNITICGRKQAAEGRGCYVCPKEGCVELALKKGRFSRALRRNINALPSKDELLSRAGIRGVTG